MEDDMDDLPELEQGGKPTRKPPQNPIIGKNKVQEWDGNWDVLWENMARSESERAANRASILLAKRKIDSMALWVMVRDVIVILLLVGMCFYLWYRAQVFDSMQQACYGDMANLEAPTR
jgi:hypothetical protein